MADITPTTGVLHAVRNQRLPWKLILGEFIDNAFDAGASRVSVLFDSKYVVIEDDGHGCEDLLKMLRLGDRHQHSGTQLGRYGVGAKDAAIAVADAITIRSVRGGIKQSLTCNWKSIERSNSWIIDDPVSNETTEANGTTIDLTELVQGKPDFIALRKALSLQYTPAIKSGRQIILQSGRKKPPVAVPEFRIPQLEHQMTVDIDVSGKAARVTMGIVPEGCVSDLSGGVIISYGYRVITTNSRLGLCDSPTPNLFGWVELGDGWELTKNKDNVSSNLEPLGKAIYEACRSTIDRAAHQATNVLFDGIAKDVNDALEMIAADSREKTAKAKRSSKSNATGTTRATGCGSPHTQAARIQSGRTFSIGKDCSHTLRIAFKSIGIDGPSSQYLDGIVYLNRDIPAIAGNMNDRDAIAVHAVYSAAAWIATDEGQQKRFPFAFDGQRVADSIAAVSGRLLSKLRMEANQEQTRIAG